MVQKYGPFMVQKYVHIRLMALITKKGCRKRTCEVFAVSGALPLIHRPDVHPVCICPKLFVHRA